MNPLKNWRILCVALLLVLPILILVGLGSWFLWQQTYGLVVWWSLTLCIALGYSLAWHWQRQKRLVPPLDFNPEMHWTQRDREAWRVVVKKAESRGEKEAERVGQLSFYVQIAESLAMDLARFYHPKAKDPIGRLTIPEILAVVELASHDLSEMVERYLPAGHLLTIDHWRQAHAATTWYKVGSNIYWAISALFSPLNTGMRYFASKYGISQPWQNLQLDLTVWFVTAYIHRLGSYLIDVYSGRLRVGATRYRELRDTVVKETPEPASLTIAVVGQVKAGKSSLVNAIVGQSDAKVDVVPATSQITRYERRGSNLCLSLLDTVGYGHEGPSADQLKATEEACRQADVILLVMHATNPGRQADVDLLRRLRDWFGTQPQFTLPPLLGVMTHIDLLSPALEWQPPYDWQHGTRLKEKTIAAAREAAVEQFGNALSDIVPVCTAAGKLWGLEEQLVPAILKKLPEAKVAALHRLLKAEADAGRTRKMIGQVFEAGKGTLQALWELAGK